MDGRRLSVDEIVKYLGENEDTTYTWLRTKGLPGGEIGRFWKYKKVGIDEWVRDGAVGEESDGREGS